MILVERSKDIDKFCARWYNDDNKKTQSFDEFTKELKVKES